MIKTLIVYEQSFGLHQDADIIEDIINRCFPLSGIYRLTIPPVEGLEFYDKLELNDIIRGHAPFDFVFFLEHIIYHDFFLDRSKFTNMIFIPNVEWITEFDEYLVEVLGINLIFLKNCFSFDRLKYVFSKKDKLKTIVTGWSSVFPKIDDKLEYKDFNRFLHIAGTSNQKGSNDICSAWLSQSEMPRLTLCKRGDNISQFSIIKNIPSVETITDSLCQKYVTAIQKNCGVHIYPSNMEGFGHALNQCRAAGSVLLTTAGDPMRGFVNDGEDGFLMKAKAKPLRRTSFYSVDPSEIVRLVHHVSSIPHDRLREIGSTARSRFWREKAEFEHRFIEALS